ncbi:MAG: hypothetical protein NT129_03335 [Candidatus Aenigmarchaeota archaeon]|nr:hypothetical protein [Candidatus Aenigmarchaeota archaeon]
MAKSLPELINSFSNVGFIHMTTSVSDLVEKNINKAYLVQNDLPPEKKIEKVAEIVLDMSSKLDKIDSVYTAGFDFNLEKYFETGDVSSLFEHSFRTKKGPNMPNFIIMDAASLFKQIAKSDGEATIGINCDFFVPEFREAEKYFQEYFRAFHNAFPYTTAREKWNQYSPNQKVDVIKYGDKILKITNDEVIDCNEWVKLFEKEIKPEMEKKIEKARQVILCVYNKCLSEKAIHFLIYSSVVDNHKKSSIRRDYKSTSEEFLRHPPNLFDAEIFDKVSNYPSLTISRTFEYEAQKDNQPDTTQI